MEATLKENKSVVDAHIESTEDNARPHDVRDGKVMSVALADAVAKDNVSWTAFPMLKLYAIMGLVTLACCMNGYDGSVMGSLNAMPAFHSHFQVGKEGSGIGLITAIYSVGQIVGCLFAVPAADIMGRRFGMSIGSAVVLIGSIVQASTDTLGGFVGGRFLVGLGVTLLTTSAPSYLIEIAYPSWRGICGGVYNVCSWYVGAITASWTTYGTGHMTSNWSWRIPVIVQAVPALVCMIGVWTIPESPRWLIMHDQMDRARSILVKLHGAGREDSAVVQLECEEIQASVASARELAVGQQWWDFRILVSSQRIMYRMWLVLLVTVFSQFIGGAMSYYMPTIYSSLGIDGAEKQLLLNALSMVVSFVFGLAGSTTVDRFGRRNLFLWGTALTGVVYLVMNVLAATAHGNIAPGPGYTFITCTFLYGAIFSFTWTPLQSLYPAEIMRNDFRIKGMAAQGFLAGLAGFLNMYAFPVALQNIGWGVYTIFLVIHAVEWAAMWWGLVETKGRSIEELEYIFTQPHPVKASLQKTEVVVAKGVGIKVEKSSS